RVAGAAAMPRGISLEIFALENVEAGRADRRHVRVPAAMLLGRGYAGLANIGAAEDESSGIRDVVIVRILPEVSRAESEQEPRRDDVVGDAGQRPVRRLRPLRIVG